MSSLKLAFFFGSIAVALSAVVEPHPADSKSGATKSRVRALAKAAAIRRRAAADNIAPLSVCQCDSSISQSWQIPSLVPENPISSVITWQNDVNQCWTVLDESDVCDGPCLIVTDCSLAVTFSRWPAVNGVDSVFRVNDPERDDDGFCVQENKVKKYLQVWACGQPGNYSPSFANSFLTPHDDWGAYSLIEEKVDVGNCIGDCSYSISSTRTPTKTAGSSPSSSPTPSVSPVIDNPLTTCACDGSSAQSWQVFDIDQTGVIQHLATGLCWNIEDEGSVCDGACLTLGDCNGPNAAYFTRGTPEANFDPTKAFFYIAFSQSVPDAQYWCVQQNKDHFYMQAWPCDDTGAAPGEDWTYVTMDDSFSALSDNWRPLLNQTAQCLDPRQCGTLVVSSTPTPSATVGSSQSSSPTSIVSQTRTPSTTRSAAPGGGAASSATGTGASPGAIGAGVGIPLALIGAAAAVFYFAPQYVPAGLKQLISRSGVYSPVKASVSSYRNSATAGSADALAAAQRLSAVPARPSTSDSERASLLKVRPAQFGAT